MTWSALLAVAAVALLPLSVSAQMRGITGTVVDEGGQPVPDALVVAELVRLTAEQKSFSMQRVEAGEKWSARSRADGEYFVELPATGVYLVTASASGRVSAVTRVQLGSGRAAATLKLVREMPAAAARGSCGSPALLTAFTQSPLGAGAHQSVRRLLQWLEAVHRHTPGCRDAAATDIGRWPEEAFPELIRDVRELTRFLDRARAPRAEFGERGSQQRDQLVFAMRDRRFTVDELEREFYGGNTLDADVLLKRGAILHADIAMFIDGRRGAAPLVSDGSSAGWRRGTIHWDVGRQLIESVRQTAAQDPEAVLWYRAVAAHLFKEGHLDELTRHLDRARRTFPGIAAFIADTAYLYLELSSPAVQSTMQAVRAGGADIRVGSVTDELRRAERYLRQAASLDPDDLDVRVRLGRTLSELGRHDEGAIELQAVIEAEPTREQRYLAELSLGRIAETLKRPAQARSCFERAAALFPYAQSAHVALARLARDSGDGQGASEAMRRALTSSKLDVGLDPWWSYYQPHRTTADGLIAEMRTLGDASR